MKKWEKEYQVNQALAPIVSTQFQLIQSYFVYFRTDRTQKGAGRDGRVEGMVLLLLFAFYGSEIDIHSFVHFHFSACETKIDC